MLPTIFVPLASLPDKELPRTVQELFANAEHPERVHVSVVAYGQPWAARKKLVALTKRHPNLAVEFRDIPVGSFEEKIKHLGVGANRNAATRKYSGQDYVLQVDAHTMVAKNWDTKLIDLHTRAQAEVGDKTAILTAYATPYAYAKGKRKFLTECFKIL